MSSIEALMKELQEEYLNAFPQKFVVLREEWQKRDIDSLKNEFHKLKGTGRTYGIPEISELAISVETKLDSHPERLDALLAAGVAILEKIVATRKAGKTFDLSSSPEYQQLTKS